MSLMLMETEHTTHPRNESITFLSKSSLASKRPLTLRIFAAPSTCPDQGRFPDPMKLWQTMRTSTAQSVSDEVALAGSVR